MAGAILRWLAAMSVGAAGLVSCGGDAGSSTDGSARPDLGIGAAALGPVVDNPYVAFASVRRAVYEGHEGGVAIRVEHRVRDAPAMVAGVEVTVVEVSELEDGQLVEKTEDYYAQDARSGTVYYMGERVDDYAGDQVVSHSGQWLAGDNDYRAGVFMPGDPKVGDSFEQERAPGIAEDRSTVVGAGLSVTVPAGTFDRCIETEDFDPLEGAREHKIYCAGVGLTREDYGAAGSLELVEFQST